MKIQHRRGKIAAAVTMGVLAGGTLLSTVALTQTVPSYTPHFALIGVIGSIDVSHDQTFDYGANPPPSIQVQNYNGPNIPMCQFSAISDHGSAQYQNVGGSNGYDTSGTYLQPPRFLIPLSVPVVFTLTLNCGGSGKVTAIVQAELPPPPPPPAAPVVVPPVVTTKPALKVIAPRPKPATIPTTAPTSAPAPTPAVSPTPTPVLVAAPIIDPTPSLSPTPSPKPARTLVAARSPVAAPRRTSTHPSYSFKPLIFGLTVIGWGFAILYWFSFRKKRAKPTNA